jgi:hypothetical protein
MNAIRVPADRDPAAFSTPPDHFINRRFGVKHHWGRYESLGSLPLSPMMGMLGLSELHNLGKKGSGPLNAGRE